MSWGAVLIWFYLLRAGDAARASAFLFLNPVIGLFLGALLLGEPLRASTSSAPPGSRWGSTWSSGAASGQAILRGGSVGRAMDGGLVARSAW